MGGRRLLAACVALALGGAARADDLLQVYRQARSADPVLSSADATRRVVREGVDQARAPLLPQAAAGYAYARTRIAGDDENSSRNASATLSQSLVDAGSLSRLRAARAQADAQDATFVAAEQALCARVARAYFDVLAAQDTLATVQANEDAFGQQVEQSDQRYRNGLSALVDVEQARAYHASARAATVGARRALADAREALAEITGQPAGTLQALRDDLPLDLPAPADAQAWVDAALARNPELLARRRGLLAAEADIASARAGHLPTLGANVTVGRGAGWPQPQTSYDGRTATTVGLVLNVPLFAGGATQSQVRQALYRRDGAQDDYEQRRRRIVRDTLDQYRGVLAGIEQIQATRGAVASAGKALASTRTGFGLGTQTMTDLLLAIQTQAGAQSAYSQARHQFILARLLLLQAAGSLGEADLAAVNTLLQ